MPRLYLVDARTNDTQFGNLQARAVLRRPPRIYGPEAAAFDGRWRPGDFVAV